MGAVLRRLLGPCHLSPLLCTSVCLLEYTYLSLLQTVVLRNVDSLFPFIKLFEQHGSPPPFCSRTGL